jgi:hypothetical protein
MAFWDYSSGAGSSDGSSPPAGSMFSYGQQGTPNYGYVGASLPGGSQTPGAPYGYANPFSYNSPNMFSYAQPSFNYNQPGGGLNNQIANDVQRFGGPNPSNMGMRNAWGTGTIGPDSFTDLFNGNYSLGVPDYILNSGTVDPYGWMAPPTEVNPTNTINPQPPKTGGTDTFQQLIGTPPPPPPPPPLQTNPSGAISTNNAQSDPGQIMNYLQYLMQHK